jgi:hypothetical protein
MSTRTQPNYARLEIEALEWPDTLLEVECANKECRQMQAQLERWRADALWLLTLLIVLFVLWVLRIL